MTVPCHSEDTKTTTPKRQPYERRTLLPEKRTKGRLVKRNASQAKTIKAKIQKKKS